MELTDRSWFAALNISEEQFTNCPADADPLVWGFEEEIIAEDDYLRWASEYFQLPVIKSEFFNLAIDNHLSEKYADLADWSPTYYPIYEWEDVLYVACLEPQMIGQGRAICHILASYRMMTNRWFSMNASSQLETSPAVAELPTPPENVGFGDALTGLDFGHLALEHGKMSPPPPPSGVLDDDLTPPPIELATPTPPLINLDFGALAPPTTVSQPPPPPMDLDFGALAPPATMSPPAPPPMDLDFGALAPPTNASQPPPPPMNLDFGALAPPIAVSQPPPPPVNLNFGVMVPPPPENQPPPLPANPQRALSDAAAAAAIPEENLISESMLAKAPALENCTNLDEAILYIFKVMRRDFGQLMWISQLKGKGFIPRKAFGAWSTAPATWATPVNIDDPNIFRIAYNSRLPFHGPISVNDINERYFAIWNQGRIPEHLTIVPLCIGSKECVGFVVGAEKGEDFHQKNTLRKFEHTIELIRTRLGYTEAEGLRSVPDIGRAV